MPTSKLVRHYKLDKDIAAALVAAGYNTPAKIRKASDSKLKAVKGLGQASVDSIRSATKLSS